ncbi:pyridoxamine 5'-phosphate oxidase family protein [Mycolicibacterium sp. S2-37]|uniref:pyridoxamine 5'-phosphate oxidase family protein n=1 Tax=Mycolicibacterium sp. S2-37 TaxID=2810297 RepID=UPI001A93C4E0|nr:pyridoxamine 5'-phosphate oxidase family protein [Mycolicibacterium sp. S2-37]MBO0678722.1 pyridoxamine 5'-phosphate oxidase family protein [Mycolicibacterium sp. S2-37]
MSKHYAAVAFTDSVRDVQREHGSDVFYSRKRVQGAATPGVDALTADEKDYLAERDGFYLATVSETGWPYVQFRGGPPGFVRVVDDHTIGWADFRGNLQYISTGNLAGSGRVALIAMDYAHRRRLKIFGHARVVTVEEDAETVHSFAHPGYDAEVERAVIVTVEAFDWNCPQHITPRFTAAELEPHLAPLREELSALRAENARLRETQRAG